MKILATIESVKVSRQRQNQDGTWSPVYGIKLVAGDDEILAESYRTKESLEKSGIVPGAVGKARIEFNVNEGVSEKTGKEYRFQQITLREFDLANRNISTESAQTPANGATAQPQEEKPAEPAQPAEQPQEASTEGTNLPF